MCWRRRWGSRGAPEVPHHGVGRSGCFDRAPLAHAISEAEQAALSVAIARADQSPEVISALGGRSIRVSHVAGRLVGVGNADSGNADLTIEITGLRGKGK